MTKLEDQLAALAAAGETIPYGVLARELGLRMADLTSALEALMEDDIRQSRPLRASLCVQRMSAQRLPAPGFFEKAAALGCAIPDPAAFVLAQREALYRR